MRRGEGLLELLLTPVAAARPLAHASREWLPSRAPRGGVERGSRGRLRTEGHAERAVSVSSPADGGDNKPTAWILAFMVTLEVSVWSSQISQTHPKNKKNRDPSTPRHYRTVEPQNVCRFFGALESVPRLAGSSLIT